MTNPEKVQIMDIRTKAKIKRALIQAGKQTRGMSDAELLDAYDKLNGKEPEPTQETHDIDHDATDAAFTSIVQKMYEQRIEVLEMRVYELEGLRPKIINVEVQREGKKQINEIASPHYMLADCITYAACGLNTYLVGPAGTGKTTLAAQVADALDLNFYFTNAIMQKYELYGFVDAGGNYQATPFYEWCKNGGVFLFDEIDSSQASAVIAFNATLANRIAVFPNGERVKLHEDCICFAAGNTAGKGATREYLRNPLDGASLDRFLMVPVDYDRNLESDLARKTYLENGGKDVTVADAITTKVHMLRDKANELSMTAIISTRAILKACTLVANGIERNQALQVSLYEHLNADQRAALGV